MVEYRSEALVPVLLAAASLGLCGTVLFAVAWQRARPGRMPAVESLGEAARRQLTAELLAVSPGIFQPSLVNPGIGYTLKPDQQYRAADGLGRGAVRPAFLSRAAVGTRPRGGGRRPARG